VNVKLRRKTYYSWFDHYYSPYSVKAQYFHTCHQYELSNFWGIWGNKRKKIPNFFNLLKSWLPILPNSLATLLFENSCCFYLKTLFSDRHYRILNWSKRRMHMCGRKMYSGNFTGAKLCWASSLTFVGNDPSFTAFTDEGGGGELRPLDTAGVDAAKIQLELIEFQKNVVTVKEIFLMAHLKPSCQRKVSGISNFFHSSQIVSENF